MFVIGGKLGSRGESRIEDDYNSKSICLRG